jgi:hypothetical protein
MARSPNPGAAFSSAVVLCSFLCLHAVAIPQSATTTSSTAIPSTSNSSNATQIVSIDGPINSTLEATAWALIVRPEYLHISNGVYTKKTSTHILFTSLATLPDLCFETYQ